MPGNIAFCELNLAIIDSPGKGVLRFKWQCSCGETSRGPGGYEDMFQNYFEHRAKTPGKLSAEMERVQISLALKKSIEDRAPQEQIEMHSVLDYCNNARACCGERGGKVCIDCPELRGQ